MKVSAYAAPAAGAPLAPLTIERREVGANDVLIDIEFAGICHSDIHTVNGDWGPQPFPVVPGHEIVGTVQQVGDDVTSHRVGDRVGVGCMVNSCGECTNCRNGDEQYCSDGMVPTYAGTDRDGTTTQGGTPPTSSSTPTTSSPCPPASTRPPRHRCCAPASRRTRP